MPDILLINHTRDFSAYANCNPVGFDKKKDLAAIKTFITWTGNTVKFSQIDADWSTPIAAAAELDLGTPVLIGGGESADVQNGIVAKVTKTVHNNVFNPITRQFETKTHYDCEYWIVEE